VLVSGLYEADLIATILAFLAANDPFLFVVESRYVRALSA
jgi:hypothetical protein